MTTSAGIIAQNKLLKHFIKSSFKSGSTGTMNFIDFRTPKGIAAATADGTSSSSSSSMVAARKENTLVLMHGFGLGLGFFFDNYDALTQEYDRVIAADWLGMGCSARTNKLMGTNSLWTNMRNLCKEDRALQLNVSRVVTNELIDGLHDLLVKQEGLSSFTLAGHSLGGLLSGKYALKYPKEVESLVLISPVGIAEPPAAATRMHRPDLNWKIKLADNLWKLNFTPQHIIRLLGSRGKSMVSNFLNRRFSARWNKEELQLIADYVYHISAAPAAGEYALHALLEPLFVKTDFGTGRNSGVGGSSRSRGGVYAKEPLVHEMNDLKMPVLVLYGDTDWLYYAGIDKDVQQWNNHGVQAQAAIVPGAGHHLYIDNSAVFNRSLISWSKNCAK